MLESFLELLVLFAGWIEAVGWFFFHLESVEHAACEFSLGTFLFFLLGLFVNGFMQTRKSLEVFRNCWKKCSPEWCA